MEIGPTNDFDPEHPMQSLITDFWTWFDGFAECLPERDPPEPLLDDLLERLHRIERRI